MPSNISRKLFSAFLISILIFQTLGGILLFVPKAQAVYSGTTIQKILILVHGAASTNSELSLIKDPLDKWGYSTEVFDYTEDYDLVHDSVGGDHWYLHYISGANGHGDLDLVTNGNMQYSTIIFDPKDASAYTDIETSARIAKQMFTSYPFLGIVRKENGYAYGSSTNNLFQVGTTGGAAKNLTLSNPTGIWALEPLKGYVKSFIASQSNNISARTADVVVLENFDDATPAITMANYSSGARAIYFAFKDWGTQAHVSVLVRLIQQYSGIPYKKAYYSYEVDDGGVTTVANAEYTDLVDFVKTNLDGYPTISLQGMYLDSAPPENIFVWGQNPNHYNNTNHYNSDLPALVDSLKSYNDYVIASHGYQHDRDLWKWTATGLPVDGFADQDGDGILNWQDDTIESGVANNSNSNLTLYSGAEFADPDLAFQEVHLARVRTLFDSYGLNNYHVLTTPKFVHLNESNALFSKYGFNVISGKLSTGGYTMTEGYQSGAYIPGRVAPNGTFNDADVALTSGEQLSFKNNFWGYIGNYPLSLITSHLTQMQQGSTPDYEMRDSLLSGYVVMNDAGYKLVSTQAATNKNIGWLWTTMSSTSDSSGNIDLILKSSAFSDGATKHELDIIMPFEIKQVISSGDYLINVDGNTLYVGKQSGTIETLAVQTGTYDSSIPRISSISTPATDVLNATYDSGTEKISLTLDGTFSTDISINNFNKPFSQGITNINSNGNEILTLNLTEEVVNNSVDMAIIPASGSIDVSITTWNTSGDYSKEWIETGSGEIDTVHTVGDLKANTYYTVKVDSARFNTYLSNSSGEISFTYDGGYSTKIFEVEEDTTEPAVFDLSSPSDNAYTNDNTPTLSWNASSDSESGLAKYQLYIDGSLDKDNISSSSTSAIPTNPLSCGAHTWHVKAIDNAGNSTSSSAFNLTMNCGGGLPPGAYNPPSVPSASAENPQGKFSVIINNGDETTDNQTVNLKLYAGSDTARMAISNTEDFKYASQIPYQEEYQWDLSDCNTPSKNPPSPLLQRGNSQEGNICVVYAKFYTQYGVASEVVSDSIIYNSNTKTEERTEDSDQNKSKDSESSEDSESNENIAREDNKLFSFTFTKTLQFGSHGTEVIKLQDKFKQLNFFSKEIESNGNFGPITEQAVMDYQKSKDIYPNGIVGPRTRKALNNEEFITNKDYKFNNDLKYNDKNEDVKQLQTRLRDQNFFPYNIPSTGWFGPITQTAVNLFKGFYNLVKNGIVDFEAREVLNR